MHFLCKFLEETNYPLQKMCAPLAVHHLKMDKSINVKYDRQQQFECWTLLRWKPSVQIGLRTQTIFYIGYMAQQLEI